MRKLMSRIAGHKYRYPHFHLPFSSPPSAALENRKKFMCSKTNCISRKPGPMARPPPPPRRTSPGITHNLLTLLLVTLEAASLCEKKVERTQTARRDSVPDKQRVPAQKMVRHAAQLTCQFIRLVRHCLDCKVPWREALPLFRRRLDSCP